MLVKAQLCLLGNFSYFLSYADFFQNQHFRKIILGIPSECQTVWIQIRPDFLSGLIWVKTICQGYQHTTLVDRDNILKPLSNLDHYLT